MSEHVCDVRKWNKFAREIAKFLTMFYSLIIAHSSCLHMLLPFSLSLYMKIYFLLFLFLTFFCFTWHWKCLSLLLWNFYYLLRIVEFVFFFFRFLPYWFESRTNLELCIKLKFLSSFRSDLNRFELLRNFYRAKIEKTEKLDRKYHAKRLRLVRNLQTGFAL